VDVYVPGCAARPESIIDGVVKGLSVLEEKQKALAVPVREKQALREKELEPEVAINRSQEAGK
jgi:ech hydrogenase subunit C